MASPAPPPAPEHYSWRLQGTVYATGFFNGNLFNMVAIVMPLWALQLEATPLMIGILLGSRQALLIFLAIHGGALMDRFGARSVIVVMGFIGTVSMALFPFFPFVAVGIALQMLSGLAESISWIGVQAMVGQAMKGNPTYSGRMTFVARMGGFVGPPMVGGAWDLWGHWGGFGLLTAWVAAGWLAAWLVPDFRERRPEEELTPAPRPRLVDLLPRPADYMETFRLMTYAGVALVVVATVTRQMGSGIQATFYVVWLEQLGISGTAIGILFSLSSALSAGSALMVGPLARLCDRHWLLLFWVFVSILCMAVTPLLGPYWLIAAVIGLRGIAQGFNLPLLISIMAQSVDLRDQAKAVALRITVNRLNALIVPVMMGAVAQYAGLEYSFYVVGGLGVACLLALAVWVARSPAFREAEAAAGGRT
jgi:MFS family permease